MSPSKLSQHVKFYVQSLILCPVLSDPYSQHEVSDDVFMDPTMPIIRQNMHDERNHRRMRKRSSILR